MAGRWVDSNWEEDQTQPTLGQTVTRNGRQYTNIGMRPEDMTRPEFSGMLSQLPYNPAEDYFFDNGMHFLASDIANPLNKLATQVSLQDQAKKGFIQKALDSGAGPLILAGGFMGPVAGAGGLGAGGLEAAGGVGATGAVPAATGMFAENAPYWNMLAEGGSGAVASDAPAIGAGSMFGGGSTAGSIGGVTGLDLGIEGIGEAAKGTFGPSLFGANANGGTLFGAANTAASGGGFIDSILSGAKSALGGVGLTPGDLAKAGINYALNQGTANKYSDAANQALTRGNPLNDPQRQPYQNQLSQLLTNPQDFYATNPAVQGQLNLAKQQFEANAGKLGTGGTVFNDYLKNVQNIASSTYNQQAQLLGQFGGFGTNGTAGVNAFSNLADKGIQQGQQSSYFFPDLMKKIFGGADNKPAESPSGTNLLSLS